ncbi:hypothetical protein LINGRAHAP2_LOCUS14705 [Linum grandiflorum]
MFFVVVALKLLALPLRGFSLLRRFSTSSYSVHWFSIKHPSSSSSLVYMGSKNFKSVVVTACWNPHLPEECMVLLENGSLFLLHSEQSSSVNATELKVSWEDHHSPPPDYSKWLGCEFAWNPTTLIVARSDAVFLIDWSSCDHAKPKVACLAKFDTSALYGTTPFVAFSKAVSSHFHFILVSASLLFVCDIRSPFSPMLQWEHHLNHPSHVQTFTLSSLRSNSNTHVWATKSGFGIVLGSFLTSEFSLFCYGPPLPASNDEISDSLYAWELPSNLNLQNDTACVCSSCLLKESFTEDVFPEKRDMVIGFGILSGHDDDDDDDEFGGFSLIRLMSSGKVELQRYYASCDLVKMLKHHQTDEPTPVYKLYPDPVEDKLTKKYIYLELEYLSEYLDGNLFGALGKVGAKEMKSYGKACDDVLIKWKKVSEYPPSVSSVVEDVSMPRSIHDIASMKAWSSLPRQLIELAFCNYCQLLQEKKKDEGVFQSLAVPDDVPQFPPFWLRNPWPGPSPSPSPSTNKTALMGPILPLPFLMTIDKFQNGSEPEEELDGHCNQVTEMIKKEVGGAVGVGNPKCLLVYRPVSFERCSSNNNNGGISSFYQGDHNFGTLITKLKPQEEAEACKKSDIFAGICPIELKFNAQLPESSSRQECRAYRGLKQHMSNWLKQNPGFL